MTRRNAPTPRESWSVYRFGDRVAISPPEGPTQYLTPAAARALANLLTGAAQDCGAVPFTESAFRTGRVDPQAATARRARLDRLEARQ